MIIGMVLTLVIALVIALADETGSPQPYRLPSNLNRRNPQSARTLARKV